MEKSESIKAFQAVKERCTRISGRLLTNSRTGTEPDSFPVVHRNSGEEHEDSTVVISIEANMNDYLQDRKTGKVVEGSKRYKEVLLFT